MINTKMEQRLKDIVEELNISDTDFETAETSYKTVGTYLENNMDCNIDVFAQGSFGLGTVIKPINEDDEYDIDLVCVLEMQNATPKELKESVGNALKGSKLYSAKMEEGKRCWTIHYEKYHMDILPVIASNGIFKATHKDEHTGEYTFIDTDPIGYKKWFNEKQKEVKQRMLLEKANQIKCSVDRVPEYKVKTPLQQAVQLLKRYRDIKFEDNLEDKPISIIITTIMGNLYQGETSLYEMLNKFADQWVKVVTRDMQDKIIISNPTLPNENFADKWASKPEKKQAFFDFAKGLKVDLLTNSFLTEGKSIIKEAEQYKKVFGSKIVERVYESYGNASREARENSNMYVDTNTGNINFNNQEQKVENYRFYGKA